MKTSTRYLIVAVVMCIFLCIVMYLFIDSSKPAAVPSGPCGKGGCAENTNVVPPPPPEPNVNNIPTEPVVSESNMFTTPVSIPEDDEAAPIWLTSVISTIQPRCTFNLKRPFVHSVFQVS